MPCAVTFKTRKALPVAMDCIIIRYAEIALKGQNRSDYEERLCHNIRECLRIEGVTFEKVYRLRGRIIILAKGPCVALSRVFGIHSYSEALMLDPSLDALKTAVPALSVGASFRVSCQRIDKSFPFSSKEVEQQLGALVLERFQTKVSLKGYETEIGVEIIKDHALLFTERVAGQGGLPLGTSGTCLGLISSTRDVLASWLLMKRGVKVVPVMLVDVSLTLLERYSYGVRLQPEKPQDINTLISRYEASAVVMGQTLATMREIPVELPVLRPLIGYTDREIAELKARV